MAFSSKEKFEFHGITDLDFDAESNFATTGLTTTDIGDWTFTQASTGEMTIHNGDGTQQLASGADRSLYLNSNFGAISNFTMKSTDGTEFDLISFAMASVGGGNTSVTISGYKDGVETVAGEAVSLGTSDATGNITYAKTTTSGGTLTFNDNFNNVDEIRFVFGGAAAPEFDDIDIGAAVSPNTAPVIGGTSAGQAVNDNSTISPFSVVTVTDADGDNLTATITLDTNAKGVLTGADAGSGPYTMTSRTAAAMQTALRALSFNPTDNRTATTETTTFTLVINDGTVDDTDNTTTVISSAVGPNITAISIPNTTMNVGDVVTATITVDSDADDYTSGSGGISGTIGGFTVGSLTRTNATTYRATFTVSEGGTDVAAGSSIPVSVTLTDSGGKAGNTFTTAISQNADAIDANSPSVTNVTIPNSAVKVGSAVSVSITAGEAGLSLNSGTVNGVAVTGFTDNGGGSYTATYTVVEGNTDRASGDNIPVSFVLNDVAGNSSATFNTAISQNADAIDANSPSVTNVTIPNSAVKVGNAVTVSITASEAGLSLNSGTVNGVAVTGFTDNGGGNYTATYTVAEGNTDRAADDAIPVSFILNDAAGNSSATFNTAISQNADAIDANTPSFENSTPSSSSIGETGFTLSVDITESGAVHYVVVADGATAPTSNEVKAGTASGGGSAVTSGTQALSSGGFSNDISVTGLTVNTNYDVYVVAEDDAGNISSTSKIDVLTVDTTAPTLQSSSPSDGATNVTLSQNLTMTFDDNIVIGTGSITIVETGVGNFEALDVTNGSLVSVSGATVTLNPSGTLKKGTAYHILVDASALDDDATNSFVGISDATALNFTTVDVVINEVVTDPQQDWSTNGFNGTVGAGSVTQGTDEWVELLINSAGIDFTGWTIELNDGTDVTGDLTTTGAFDAQNYVTAGSGTFNNTESGDYLVLGNVDGSGTMNNTGLTINLKDPGGAIVDAVVIGGGAGEAPSGNASGTGDETVQRFTNGLDTDTHNNDFTLGAASLGASNTGPSVTLSQSTTTFVEAAGTNTITATLSAASSQNTTVTIAIKAGGTATITDDFTLSTTSIVISAGSTTGTVTLTAVQDALDETNETITVEITGVTNGTEDGTQEVASSITDDDAAPTVTLSQSTTTIAEAAGTNTVTATLSAASGQDVTVTVGIKAGGTATITDDFTLSTTSIVISAGSTTGTATLTAVQDALDETNETITVEITGVTNGTEDGTQEVASSITDDDAAPTVTLSQSTTTIAEAAGTNTVTATLSAASGQDVTVTVGIKAGGTATITDDFTLSTTSIVISAGSTTGTSTLTAVQDALDETNETITVEITGVTNGTEDGAQEVASSITDDDAAPTVTLSQSTTTIAEAAGTNTVTATLSAASGQDVTVTVGIKAGGTATITDDFTLSTTSIVISAGSTTGTSTLTAVQDALDETNETITVEITGVTNGTEDGAQEVASSITDDDAAPTVTLSQSTTTFAEAAGTNTVTATLSAASGQDVTVTVGIKAGGTATITDDFTLSTTSITINAGSTTGTATLTAVQDALDETNETITVEITAVTNGTEDGAQEVASSITDDDAAPTVTLSQSTTTFAEAAGTNTVTATLSAASGQDVTVTVGIKAGGTATITDDFTLSTTSITINAGSTTGTSTLTAVQDVLDEDNETITVEITGVTNGTENGTQEVASSITDDDAAPSVTFGIATSAQAESEPSQDLPIGLSAQSGKTITVDYALSGTATGGGVDYTMPNGTFTFDPGDQNLTLQIVGIIDDVLDEDNETIILTLSNPVNATLGAQSTLTYTITDNDAEPTVSLSVGSNSIAEAAGTSNITATLSAVSGRNVTVTLAYSGSATNGTDYNNTASTSIVISAGSLSANAAVGLTATQDAVPEGNETIDIDITGVTNGTENGTQQQTVSIIDDDAPVVTNVSSSTANGSYKVGDVIEVTVTFTQVVTVTGIPQLTLETGATDRIVDVTSGTGSTTLVFAYTVQSGDVSGDLDYVSTSSLALNGGTIKNAGGIDAVLTLASPSNAGSLGANKALIVDTSVPTAPSVTSITSDSGSDGADEITNDNTLKFNGTAEANSTVEVFIGGTSIGTTTADGSGNFSFDHTGTTLSDGTISVTATATDAAGNTSSTSSALSVTVDTTAPLVPSIDAVTDDTGSANFDFTTSDNTVTFTGTAEANGTVEVFIDAASIGTTSANGSGAWSFDHTGTTLADNTYTITAKTTDAAGNTSESSTAVSLVVDTAAPSTPVVSSITSDSGTDGADEITNDNTLLFNGTAEVNSTVEVFIGGTSIGTTTADGSGNFSFDHTGTTLSDGTYSVTAKATDLAGNSSATSAALSVVVDTATPSAPAVTSITSDNGIDGADEITNDNTLSFNGTAEANSTVEVFIDGVSIGTTTTDGSGNFSFDHTGTTLADASYSVTAKASDAAGNSSSTSSVLSVVVDTTSPAAPSVNSITTDSGTDGADEITDDNTLIFNGTAEANSLVEVLIGGVSVGTTSADGSGNFAFDHTATTLADGTYQVTAKTTDKAGNSSAASSAIEVIVDTTAPAAPAITAISTDSGDSNSDQITNDNTPAVNGTAEANSTVEIFSNGSSIGSANADGSGNWSLAYSGNTPLADDVYVLTAKATDVAGNTSSDSAPLSVTIDATAPNAPTLDLSEASDSGISATDNITNDKTPGFEGTAEPNVTIEVFVDGVSRGTTTADGSGNWTLVPNAPFNVGSTNITAKATDAAGNTSSASVSLTLVVDDELGSPLTTPADDAVDVLPSANLILTFNENVNKGTGDIVIKKKSDDSVIETIDVTSGIVTISNSVVTIDPSNLILPTSTEFYVTVAATAFSDDAGNMYAGINNNTDWTFTIIAASTVNSVTAPSDGTSKIGDNLDFTVNMVLPVTITGTTTIPLTIGSSTVSATQVGSVTNSTSIQYRYTVAEGDLDGDGIAVGSAIDLNGGTMKDEFGVDAILTLNNVGSTSSVLVDGVKPTVALSSTSTSLVNGAFEVIVEFDELVAGFSSSDLSVTNGTTSNFTAISNDKKWSFDVTPSTDGTVTVALSAGIATDVAGNENVAATNLTRTFDGTAPEVVSINRKDADPLVTGTTSADFRVIFSEDVTGVDLTDFEVILTGSATGTLNTITAVDAKTYDINVNGIGGQGTVGLNAKDDDTIIDAALNALAGTFTGQVYTTNYIPTDISISSSSIQENNAVGDMVGALTSSDIDATDTHTYTLVSGTGDTDNASFTIDGSNLKAAEVFDFETKTSYFIRVKTDDGKGGVFEKALTITVTNELEGDIVLSGDLDFEATALGLGVTKTLTITNIGEKAVEVRIISVPTGFTMALSSAIVEVGESISAPVIFRPSEVRAYAGSIVAEHEDGVESIEITGEGAIVTGVDTPIISEEDIKLFPNPATTSLEIDLTNLSGAPADLMINDASGVSVLDKKGVTQRRVTVDVSGYRQGVYILTINSGGGLVKKKVIIRR